NDYLLSGTKIYISNAGIADFYTTIVRTDSGKHGISAFVVDAKSDGLSVELLEMIAPHPIGILRFEDCRVKASQMLGQPGDGYKIALANLDTFRPTVGAAAIGFGRRAMDESLQHAKRRVQFGKPLSDFQAIQFKLAEMATELDAATLLVYRAAHLKDSGVGRTTKEAAMAKLFATEAAQRAIDEAVQIHGGSGLVRGAITERLYRDIRAMRIYEGTSEIQKLIIAGQLLKD
ncbi:MAG: acyl-CoA dehydrogenase family protein, partial [Blastocatellia bacterium]|nr:acyl-CoA dehydrogenase family protein [Blastocatellia bacterium]